MNYQRNALLALLLSTLAPAAARAADVPLPPPPAGTSLSSYGSSGRTFKVAVLGGFLAQGEVSSASLGVDVGMVATPAKWKKVQLELHVPVRVARPSWESPLTRTFTEPYVGTYEVVVGTTEDTVWLGEALAAGRLLLPVAPGFALFAEAGVGLAFTVEEHVEDEVFVGVTTERQLVLAPAVQASIGLTYRLGERLDVVFQPVVLGRRAKSDESTFSALWGLSYRL